MLKTMRITTSNSKQSNYIFFFYHFMSTTFCSYQLSKSSNRFSLDGLAQSFVQAHLTLGLYENHTGLLIFLYQFWAFAVYYELASGPDFELKLAYILTLILDRHDSGLAQSIGPGLGLESAHCHIFSFVPTFCLTYYGAAFCII